MIILNINKISLILKECFLFYSFRINNCIIVNNEKKYKFNYTENVSLYNFADSIKENKNHFLNIDWLFDYFNYQFSYWNFIKEKKEQAGSVYIIQLHWILGPKALNRYNSRTQKDSYFYHSNFYSKFKIQKDELIEYLRDKKLLTIEEEKEEEKNRIDFKEENIKRVKYNTIEGFNLCLNFTTLFKFNSDLCKKCKYKKNCKNILKFNYPIIYRKRVVQNFKNKQNEGKE